jgi:hypothetical protein
MFDLSRIMTYGREVASSNGKTDGERCRALDVIAMGIAHAEDDEQQQETEEELHAEALQGIQVVVHGGHAQVAAELLGSERLKTKTRISSKSENKNKEEKCNRLDTQVATVAYDLNKIGFQFILLEMHKMR